MKQSAYILFGRSGCGKGTQAALLQQKLEAEGKKVIYIETGNLLRAFSGTDSYTSKRAKQVLETGELMPEFLPIYTWAGKLVASVQGDESFIFDGVSRRIHEAPIIETMLGFYDRLPAHIIYVDVSRTWSSDRLRERMRADDTDASIDARQDWFESSVLPALEYFKSNPNFVFHTISGEQSIELVHGDILKSLDLQA
ncbi:MAG: nucleoside monophosphate kinase [Candidatus Pacebacteria bacterium]|nr:nucleoside monophosphate kinase [Candidatus Paceibacterota bacterium]